MNINSTGEVLTVFLQGEIDHHTAKGMREEIDRAIDFNMPSLLILDFSQVTFMDSSVIGLVMGRFKNLQNIVCHVSAYIIFLVAVIRINHFGK